MSGSAFVCPSAFVTLWKCGERFWFVTERDLVLCHRSRAVQRFCHPGSLGSTTYNSFSGFASPPEKQDKNFTASQEHNPLPVAMSGFVALRWEALQKHVIFFLALLLMNALVAPIKVFKRITLSCCAFTTSSHRAHLSAEMCAPTDSPRCTASFSPAPARPPLPSDMS